MATSSLTETLTQMSHDAGEACAIDNLLLKTNRVRGDFNYVQMPISLVPTPLPLDMYKEAYSHQQVMGELVAAIVSNPRDSIHVLLEECASRDPFMERLIRVSKTVCAQREAGEPVQDIHCLILRNDFMIDQPTQSIKLVEYNTIATGFVCLGSRTQNVHDYILEKYGRELPLNYDLQDQETWRNAIKNDPEMHDLPFHKDQDAQFNNYIDQLAQSVRLYKETTEVICEGCEPWVLIVADIGERNICDQKAIEMALHRRHGIRAMRKQMDEIARQGELDDKKRLKVAGHEIGFVYFRTGYNDVHYKIPGTSEWNEERWTTREMLECSVAIKCPSVDVQLAGFKKYQHAFSDEQLLLNVAGSEVITNKLKHLFKGIWSLEDLGKDGAEVGAIVEDAIANPHKYVLKPQKEGGGNNFFDDAVREQLLVAKSGEDTNLLSYLVMERIRPPIIPGHFLINAQLTLEQTLSEFGFYSAAFSKNLGNGQHTILSNEVLGTLMRSKASHVNEGGVSLGLGVIDSPFIVHPDVFKSENAPVKGLINM